MSIFLIQSTQKLDFVECRTQKIVTALVSGFVNKSKMDSFKKCFRCQGDDTSKIHLGCGDFGITYIGWCNSCNREYSYSERIVDIHDKKKRI